MTKPICNAFLATTASLAIIACSTQSAETNAMESDTGTESAAMAEPMGMPVTVTINGVQPGGGQVFVALQSEGEFLQAAGTYKTKVDASSASVTATFEDVAPGSYVAAAVHDENADGEIELGGRGPTEAWGISGAAQNGKPAWMPAMFDVSESGGSAIVTLSYD
ncbi:DUF2141 domain-containing protein [Erythrobacter litoralis]|uniref:DUF2141 domain-containing protein n=1 Tax=Erythrobacter litoralis TaxID=39960 RepID=UPI002434CA64|nr:DUF2141 domain-containing protein [Erythrobacter litoralis]MDG6080249.1 DUF2141 domain-containing protein [Erythrobacter litoralis]